MKLPKDSKKESNDTKVKKTVSLDVTLPPVTHSIFHQKSKAINEEMSLINLTVKRKVLLESVLKNITDVNNKLIENTSSVMYESFLLFNNLRCITLDLVEGMHMWQQGFTKSIRPQLNESDYVIKMIHDIDFISSTSLRRLYSFQFQSGNIFLLPLHNPRSLPPHEVNRDLGNEIMNFAYPSEERLFRCYKILADCMSPMEYRKLLQLNIWLNNRWKPDHVIQLIPTTTHVTVAGTGSTTITAAANTTTTTAAVDNVTNSGTKNRNTTIGKRNSIFRAKTPDASVHKKASRKASVVAANTTIADTVTATTTATKVKSVSVSANKDEVGLLEELVSAFSKTINSSASAVKKSVTLDTETHTVEDIEGATTVATATSAAAVSKSINRRSGSSANKGDTGQHNNSNSNSNSTGGVSNGSSSNSSSSSDTAGGSRRANGDRSVGLTVYDRTKRMTISTFSLRENATSA